MYFGVGVGIAIGLLTLAPVAAPPIPTTHAMRFDFPKGCSGDIPVVTEITLRENGETVLDGVRVANDDAVAPYLRPEARLFLDAAPSIPHGRVVHVMDLARRAGIEQIVFDRYAAMRIVTP